MVLDVMVLIDMIGLYSWFVHFAAAQTCILTHYTMRMLWGMDKTAMKQRHVLFQEEDQDTYVREMLTVFAPA